MYFDPPVSAPAASGPYLPFLQPYTTGPVPVAWAGEPLRFLVMRLGRLDEAGADELIGFGAVWLDDRPAFDPKLKLSAGQSFRINPPAGGPVKFYECDLGRIALENDDLLVYDKEAGRPSQAVPHDAWNNALAGLQRLLKAREGRAVPLWLTHRLDADTSGLLLFAKNKKTAAELGKAFQSGLIHKEYLCLAGPPVNGPGQTGGKKPEARFTVKAAIAKEGGRYVARYKGPGLPSETRFELLESQAAPDGGPRFLLLARPITGRTHQIRLHLQLIGWPVVGDRFYQGLPAPRLMLRSIGLTLEGGPSMPELKLRLPLSERTGRPGLGAP